MKSSVTKNCFWIHNYAREINKKTVYFSRVINIKYLTHSNIRFSSFSSCSIVNYSVNSHFFIDLISIVYSYSFYVIFSSRSVYILFSLHHFIILRSKYPSSFNHFVFNTIRHRSNLSNILPFAYISFSIHVPNYLNNRKSTFNGIRLLKLTSYWQFYCVTSHVVESQSLSIRFIQVLWDLTISEKWEFWFIL